MEIACIQGSVRIHAHAPGHALFARGEEEGMGWRLRTGGVGAGIHSPAFRTVARAAAKNTLHP